MTQTPDKCKMCGSTTLQCIYPEAPDYITGNIFAVWQCQKCEGAFTYPVPDDLSPYYPASYRRYHPAILLILKTIYRQHVRRWARKFDKPGIAFEVGCGDGMMLATLREEGWQVFGNERTAMMASFAHDRLNLPVFAGELDAIRPTPYFDLVFLFQVLEHIEDPVQTLQQISQILNPGGRLIIGVPNFKSWQATFGKTKWLHLEIPRHLTHFSLQGLEESLKQANLEVEAVRYISFEHDLIGWIQGFLNRIDTDHNRLLKLLMRMESPNLVNILHLLLAFPLGILSLPLAIISWIFRQGALIEVTARHPS